MCIWVRREKHVSSQTLFLTSATATPSLPVSYSFMLPCWPFIYTCQEVAIKNISLHRNFITEPLYCWKKNKSVLPPTALGPCFGDLFRAITLTAHRRFKHWFDWKITKAFFSLPCSPPPHFSRAVQGPLSLSTDCLRHRVILYLTSIRRKRHLMKRVVHALGLYVRQRKEAQKKIEREIGPNKAVGFSELL